MVMILKYLEKLLIVEDHYYGIKIAIIQSFYNIVAFFTLAKLFYRKHGSEKNIFLKMKLYISHESSQALKNSKTCFFTDI